MKNVTQRSLIRAVHLILSIPIAGYIYSPFEDIPNYAPMVRFVFLPVIVLSGLWMWKGHLLRARGSSEADLSSHANRQ